MDLARSFDPAILRPSGALLSTHLALSAAIEDGASRHSPYDATVLDLLVRLDLAPGRRLRAVELCRQLRLSPSHISRSIDKAVTAGLVERRPDPDDRRAKVVTLTTAGEAVVADFAPRLEAVLTKVIHETLSDSEIDTLVELVGRIEAACEGLRNG